MEPMRICSKCKIYLPFSSFHKSKGNRDGLHSSCKQCNIDTLKIARNKNKEKYLKKYKEENARRKLNPEFVKKNRERVKLWRQNNPSKRKAQSAKYRIVNHLHCAAYSKARSLLPNVRKRCEETRKQRSNLLKDGEIVKLIIAHKSGLKASQVTPELIEAKRTHLKIVRKLKELKK